jgi:hypothetical protein
MLEASAHMIDTLLIVALSVIFFFAIAWCLKTCAAEIPERKGSNELDDDGRVERKNLGR